ncbi:MAG: hypothetical protein KKD77_20980 [Gammaproteobacteria bacterium]|nr:hypothetical protein [Gammaproteobacteria bacterium]
MANGYGFDLSQFDFSKIATPEMPILPEQNWLGKTKDFLSSPQFQVLAGQTGAALGGPGSFGEAVGTPAAAYGQSRIANKAFQEQKQERQDYRKLVADIMSGNVPMTAAGTPGISGVNIKPGKEGGTSEMSFSVTEPTDKKKREVTLDLQDIVSSPF